MLPVYVLPPRSRLWCRVLQWIAVLIVVALVSVAVWWRIPAAILDAQMEELVRADRPVGPFSPLKQMIVTGLAWGFALTSVLIPTGAAVVFRAFASGRVFDAPAVRSVRFFGWMVVAFAVAQTLTPTVMQFALTADNPPGTRVLTLGLSSTHVTTLLVGLVVLAIAQVYSRAAEIADEHGQIV
jgi:hypothetical protein